MNKQSSYMRSAFLLTLVFLLFVVISAQTNLPGQPELVAPYSNPAFATQKESPVVTVVPLKDVDVELARYGGAQFSGGGMGKPFRVVATDADGKFTFVDVPAGFYSLAIRLPKETDTTTTVSGASAKALKKGRDALKTNVDSFCLITIYGAKGGKKEAGWNFEANKAFAPTKPATAKSTPADEKIILESNGRDPFTGTVIKKSRSNINNH